MMWVLAAAVLALTAPADVERVPVDWQVLSAGRDVGALRLIYEYGGCQRGDGRATVRETPSQIHIAVDVSEVVAVDGPDPRPGAPAGDRRVGLTLGRHAFDARALKRCVEAVGLRVAAGRPEFGDEDAPDLELVVTGLYFPGYVALYADPARARENAPGIRRRVRAVGGTLERFGRVTIAWVGPAGATIAERVRACVAGARP